MSTCSRAIVVESASELLAEYALYETRSPCERLIEPRVTAEIQWRRKEAPADEIRFEGLFRRS